MTTEIERNWIVRAIEGGNSRKNAINAMCYHCMGCTKDHMEPGVMTDVRNCTSTTCPLYNYRPHK
jgi:hypothetical protein